MRYISKKEYESKMKRIQARNVSRRRRQCLKEERDKYKPRLKLPTTSKLMAAYLFAILNIVLVYAMLAMWHFMDLSYLGVLITDVAAQVLTYTIYSVKALKENSAGGITYDMAFKNTTSGTDENEMNKPTGVG